MKHHTTIALAMLLAAVSSQPAIAAEKEPGTPNPVKTGIAKAVGKVRTDADMLTVLKAHESLNPKAIEKVDVATARANPTIADAVAVVLEQQGRSSEPTELVPGVTSKDQSIAGAAGQLPARIYTPDGAGPFPVVVYFHGGGWVIADKAVYDGGARGLAKQANAVVVSVDYRRAPENKFPAAWDDALASYKCARQRRLDQGRPEKSGACG